MRNITNLHKIVGWLVEGQMSHSVIFQLHVYIDRTVAQFPNLDLLPSTQCHLQLGIFYVPSLPGNGHVMPDDVMKLLVFRRQIRCRKECFVTFFFKSYACRFVLSATKRYIGDFYHIILCIFRLRTTWTWI